MGKDSRGKGSQVYRTLELRDCGDEVNGVLILQNQLHTAIHRCPALHCAYRQTGPCVGGSNLHGESLYLLSALSLSAASESTAPAAPSGNPHDTHDQVQAVARVIVG